MYVCIGENYGLRRLLHLQCPQGVRTAVNAALGWRLRYPAMWLPASVLTGSCNSQLKTGCWLETTWPGTSYGQGELKYSFEVVYMLMPAFVFNCTGWEELWKSGLLASRLKGTQLF